MEKPLVAFLVLIMASNLTADEVIQYAVTGLKPDDSAYQFADALLSEISARMGTKYNLIAMPHKRANLEFQNGRIHADLARGIIYEEMVAGSFRVEEPIISYPYYAYSKNIKSLDGQGLDSVKPYRIVTVLGSSFARENLQGFDTYAVATTKDALLFLNAGRADIFLGPRLVVSPLLQSARMKSFGIEEIQPSVTIVHHYTFFTEKYPKLAQKFNAALISTKNDGFYQNLLKQ